MNKNYCMFIKESGLHYVRSADLTFEPDGVSYILILQPVTANAPNKRVTGKAISIDHVYSKIHPEAYFRDKYPEFYL